MAGRRVNPLADGDPAEGLPAALRLQILTTEHWSLLSTRALTWNEAFSRATMFLSTVTGAVVALALVAGADSLDDGFVAFALLLLPVVLFAGVTTFVRLVQINREDATWVMGMNRLRNADVTAAPELAPYFVTGWTDDEIGIMKTFAAVPGPGGFGHEFVTTPGLVAVVNGVVAATIVGIVAIQLAVSFELSLVGAVGAGVATVLLLAAHYFRSAVKPETPIRAGSLAHDDESERT